MEIYNRPPLHEEIIVSFTEGNAGRFSPDLGGRVGFWHGDDSAVDSSVGGNDGILSGDATFAVGQVGQGFSLDGTGFVQVPDSPELNITNDLTVGLWARSTSPLSDGAILVAKAGLNGAAYVIGISEEDRPIAVFFGADGSGIFLEGLRWTLPFSTTSCTCAVVT